MEVFILAVGVVWIGFCLEEERQLLDLSESRKEIEERQKMKQGDNGRDVVVLWLCDEEYFWHWTPLFLYFVEACGLTVVLST
jgi:hypothetical protein